MAQAVLLAAVLGEGCADDDSSATDTMPADATSADDGGATDSASGTVGTGATTGEATTAAADDTADDTASEDTSMIPDPRLAITADWLAGTLSLLDLAALADGATTRDEMLVDTIDLSAYAPGPLQVEITPDGATAVVTISPGFFDGLVGNLIGVGDIELTGQLLLVDIATRSVTAELSPAHVPMGIAITPDGSTAFTANYGAGPDAGTTMTVVDLGAGTVTEDIEVGGRPEQVSLSVDGALGIVNLASDGTIRTFATDDPAGSLSPPLAVSDDPSDVDFIEGTDYAIVANSLGPPNYTIVDVSDPTAPTVIENGAEPGGVPYGATAIPGTSDALVTTRDLSEVSLLRVAAGRMPSSVTWQVTLPDTVAFPLGVAVEPTLGIAVSGAPGADVLVVVGLDGEGLRTIDWLDEIGPTYVALQP